MSWELSEVDLATLVGNLTLLPRETPWVEFKENNEKPESIGEYIAALSNAAVLDNQERGYLVWGVRDADHAVVGTTVDPAGGKVGNENLENWLLHSLNPQVHFSFTEGTVDAKRVVVMQVERAFQQPVAFKGTEYIRIGSYTKPLRAHPDHARRLWRALENLPFEKGIAADRLVAEEAINLLDFQAYFDLMNIRLPGSISAIMNVLEADSMVSSTLTGHWDITNLGAVLFAKQLQDFPTLRRKAGRVIQYTGTDRTEPIKEQLGARGYAAGFTGLIEYINNLLPSNEIIETALRTTVRMYPEIAIRELVANALIHQDFSLTGTGPLVEVFADRIEITNPGTPLIDPLRFIDNPPRSRNEALAAVMRRVGICEERGSGWDKVASSIEFHQLPAPLIEVTTDHTRITLYGHKDLGEMDQADRIRAVYLHATLNYVLRRRVTNTSIRTRFNIDEHNSARASRLLKEAIEAGLIVTRNPEAGVRSREYVPFWASFDLNAPS